MATSTAAASKSGLYADPRPDWLAKRQEEVIDPSRPIVDPHHHLWDRGGQRYLIEELTDDIGSGHNIIATVYVEARSMYRAKGAEALRPVGEVEFANGAAAMSASGSYGPAAICAGIVGHANLLLGEAARGEDHPAPRPEADGGRLAVAHLVGVRLDIHDPCDALAHERLGVRLGHVGVHQLLGLPALEEAKRIRRLDILAPPVVDATGILTAGAHNLLQAVQHGLTILRLELQQSGGGDHGPSSASNGVVSS